MTYTYSVKKNKGFLNIDKTISDKDPNAYQLSFIILNLRNDSKMETGIMPANIYKKLKLIVIWEKVFILMEHYQNIMVYM
jgi:hypothetical protein